MRMILLAGLTALLTTLPAQAQHQGHPPGHMMSPNPAGAPSSKAFQEANDKMHREMTIRYTGNADVDFMKGMIPHHQGAIDMAKVVLEHGKDAETRKLAAEIIAAQEKEIAMMKERLKARGY